jgi:catechol 2,3-dioxygenase-like lactoylglutathione lyase family enzyme
VSAPPSDLVAFHLGIVVHEIEPVIDRYRRMLGVDLWRVHDLSRSAPPWNERYTDVRVRIAYGRGVGLTFELIQVLEGRNQHTEFLEAHGEGVQHIGFWSQDVRASVAAAVAEGARVVNGLLDENGNAAVQLSPGSSSADIISALHPARLAYVDPGLATVQFEFVGPGTGLRDWLQQDFERILVPPPWGERSSR